MSSRGQRLNKSQSMMFSLYTLSGLAFLVLGAFLVLAVFESLQLLSFSVFLNTLETFYKSVGLTFLPMLISLPFVLSITFLVVSQSTSKFSIPVKSFMSWVEQAPRLLFGLIFLIFIGAGPMGYILSATAIVTAQLSRRWVHLALKVDQAQIDTIKSLGGDVWQILYFLFFKKSVFKFATHFFAVYFQIFVLVTPFLVFTELSNKSQLPALELFSIVGENSEQTVALAFLITLAHGLRFTFDQFTSFWEVEYG